MSKPSGKRCRSLLAATVVWMSLVSSVAEGAAFDQQHGARLWHRLQTAAWVSEGARCPGHIVYVIADANCPFCHDLWASLRPFYKKGLQVHYVMVGILAANSPGKAAAILEAKDPAAALDRNEETWGQLPDDLGGGIPPLAKPKYKTFTALKANEQLMRDLGVLGTPALIYLDAGKVVHLIQSVPDPVTLDEIVQVATPI